MSKVRPYTFEFMGKQRIVEAISREAARKWVLDQVAPPINNITIVSAAELGRLMREGVEYEVAGEELEDEEPDTRQGDLGITEIRGPIDLDNTPAGDPASDPAQAQ
jgi:hypothetical protein